MIEIKNICRSQDGLGENPIWLEEEKSLYWANHVGPSLKGPNVRTSDGPSIKRFNVETKKLTVWNMPEQVGSFGFRKQGGLVAATNSGFCTIDLESSSLDLIVDPEKELPTNRFNDGKVDRNGRFWCGTMDTNVTNESAHIYVLEPDFSCRKVEEDYSFVVSNGIAFDPDDKRMYFADTFRKMIYIFDFDLKEGQISNKRAFFSTADYTGFPDGSTVDADGYYWIAMVQGGKILRLNPKGRLDLEINMPIPTPTCVTFGGAKYETLYVTSQKAFLSQEMLKKYPETGDIFAINGLGIKGIPEPRFLR
ncbi:MAG: SMP-30/gluconolactonase/LRE family protein [bacterium]|nr:SMP-30/gluconolactonase/LRE family protein [bacterium]